MPLSAARETVPLAAWQFTFPAPRLLRPGQSRIGAADRLPGLRTIHASAAAGMRPTALRLLQPRGIGRNTGRSELKSTDPPKLLPPKSKSVTPHADWHTVGTDLCEGY